jgi:hypothetical protein
VLICSICRQNWLISMVWMSLVVLFIWDIYDSLAVAMDESTLEITDCICSMGVVELAWWLYIVFVSAIRLLSSWLWCMTIVVKLSSCCFMVWIVSWVRLLVGIMLVGW